MAYEKQRSDDLYEIAHLIENESEYENIYNRLVKINSSIINTDTFPFELKQFGKHEGNAAQ